MLNVCQVAVHVAEKLLQLGAIPLTFSDSSGHIYEPEVSGRIRNQVLRRMDCSFTGGAGLVRPSVAERSKVRFHTHVLWAIYQLG